MSQNSEARKRHEATPSDPDTFGVYFDRTEYRDFHPTPGMVKDFKCMSATRSSYWSFGPVPSISVEVPGGPLRLSGPLYNLRATLDALELAYDRLVNPPAVTNPATSASPLKADD